MSTVSLPNLRHLNIALHINKKYGFSAASKLVNLSPSAITQAMRGLETALGAEIFDRSPAGAFPNELGKVYLNRVEVAFDALSQAEASLDNTRKKVEIKSRLSTSQLKAFISVCESGSYSLAARRLGLSQPSVYKSARSIEITFDQRLLRPSSSGVEPTSKAKEFARHANVALSEIERAQEEIQEYQGRMSGRLAIGTLPLIRTKVLPNAITSLLKDHPNAQIQIIDGAYGDLLNALRHGKLDFILGALRTPPPADDVTQEHLFNDDLSVLLRAGHPLLEKPRPKIQDLCELDWIVPRENTPTRDYFEAILENTVSTNTLKLVECSSLVATRAMLLSSDKATILSSHQASYEIEKGDLVELNMELKGSERSIGITSRTKSLPTGLHRHFLEEIHRESSKL